MTGATTGAIGADALASVVIAVNPHDHDLGAVMDAWSAQTGAGRYEVLITHADVRPGVEAVYAAHRMRRPATPVRLLPIARRGRAAANNAGAAASAGELLIFIADDFLPSAGVIAAHRAFHEALVEPAVGVGASFFPAALRADPFRRWLEDSGRLYGAPFPRCPAAWPTGFFFVGNASMARATFERNGRFDETFVHDLLDDEDWGRRWRERGGRTHYLPRAWCWHDHAVTLEERAYAVERLGAASRAYEARVVAPHPWSALVERSLDELDANAARLRAERAAEVSIARLEAWWMAELDCAFVRGYRLAIGAERPSRRRVRAARR